MTRAVVALMLMLAMGLQGSLVAFAGVVPPRMHADSPAAHEAHGAAPHACCPAGKSHITNCCAGACMAIAADTASLVLPVWQSRTPSTLQFRTAIFSSRGESPLIRPPIL